MAESGENYDPGAWKGWDFDDARKKHIDPTAGRGYSMASSFSKIPDDVDPPSGYTPASGKVVTVPEELTTDAKSPLVVVIDGTGSMGTFHKVIFEKLPLLDDGVKDYLDDCQISYSVIGDAGYDKTPLQVQPFSIGKDMVASLKKLNLESGGGANKEESYDLAAIYYARNCKMPKATKPIMVFICDEGVYSHLDPEWAKKYAHVELDSKKKMTRAALFKELTKKFSVYVVRKHYVQDGAHLDGDKLIGTNKRIHDQWVELVGEDHIALLDDPRRVVDVTLGLLAAETNKIDFFTKEITDRQTPEQVKSVMKSMTSVAKATETKADPNLSVSKKPKDGGKKTESLI